MQILINDVGTMKKKKSWQSSYVLDTENLCELQWGEILFEVALHTSTYVKLRSLDRHCQFFEL